MTRRRAFLKSLFLSALALPAAPLLGAAAPARAPGIVPRFGAPEFVIVNGWVLTEADLARLDAHAR